MEIKICKKIGWIDGNIATQIPSYVSTGTDLGTKQRIGKSKLTKISYSTSNLWYTKSLFENDNLAEKGLKGKTMDFGKKIDGAGDTPK